MATGISFPKPCQRNLKKLISTKIFDQSNSTGFGNQLIMAKSPVQGRNQSQRGKRGVTVLFTKTGTKEIKDMLVLHLCDKRRENSIRPPSAYEWGISPQNRKNKRLQTGRRETRFIGSPWKFLKHVIEITDSWRVKHIRKKDACWKSGVGGYRFVAAWQTRWNRLDNFARQSHRISVWRFFWTIISWTEFMVAFSRFVSVAFV